MANKYGRSKKWVQRQLDNTETKWKVALNKQSLIVVADVTFFSRTKGLCVFREPNLKKNVWWQFTEQENRDVYKLGRKHLTKNGFTIKAVILDGKRGVRELFKDIPVQMCQFHQKQIIQRYLTNRPKLKAGIELKKITATLSQTEEKTFTRQLDRWYEKWETFLKEKTTDPETGRWHYTHKRLRSAYRSLKTNLPYLFTYQKHPELNIPNTTNSLDGFFNALKSRLYVHRGLNKKRAKKIIVEILKGRN